jgi:AcrR family transcriptional regulator
VGIREERKAATRREIHLATVDLIEASGLEATTVAQIADRVGISDRTFFRYYDSKESAALPGQKQLIDALVSRELGQSSSSQILHELIGVCREHFAYEIERHEFLRISRLLISEPKLLHMVGRQELNLVAVLSDSLVERKLLDRMRALLVAEMIACTWRVAWQCFAQEDRAGNGSNPAGLFDKAVAYLTEITSASGAEGSRQA